MTSRSCVDSAQASKDRSNAAREPHVPENGQGGFVVLAGSLQLALSLVEQAQVDVDDSLGARVPNLTVDAHRGLVVVSRFIEPASIAFEVPEVSEDDSFPRTVADVPLNCQAQVEAPASLVVVTGLHVHFG